MNKLTLILALFLLMATYARAQETKPTGSEVIVYLKDGSAISGTLIEWDYGNAIEIVSNGVSISFPYDEVSKVIENSKKFKKRPPPNHKNVGTYYKAQTQLMTGNNGPRAHYRVGWGINATAGYQWNQFLMTGGGVGYREFIWDSAEDMIPIFVEVGGYASNTAVRPVYNLQMGYSFINSNEDFGLVEAKGGLFVYPSFGLEFGRNKLKTTFDIGYNIQKAELTYGNNFDDRVRSVQEITYRRLSFRIGIKF